MATSTTAPPCEEQESAGLSLYFSLPIICILVGLSGLFSGLTLGLMGLDLIGLETVENGDNEQLSKYAAKIKPIRKKGNLLLCTLLLGNVAVNSALSILTADIASGLVGFLVSTSLIVLFGEILPQAACSKYALQVGAATVGMVKVLICLFFVITYPISLALDYVLGKDLGQVYSTSELMEMIKLQVEKGAADEETGKIASKVVQGALNFRNKQVTDVMTPLDDAYMLSRDARLGYETVREVFEQGFSRVPVYGRDKHDFVGLLYTKDLILVDPEDEMRLGDFIKVFDRQALTFRADASLVEALTNFKKGKAHLALVRDMCLDDARNPRCEIKGVVTLEDVVEEILQDEIVDEADVYVDVDNHVKVGDGRDARHFNLAHFNPVWGMRCDRLSRDEIVAIAAHLCQTVFGPDSGMSLRPRTVEWLVSVSEVHDMVRVAPQNMEEPDPKDLLYKKGELSSTCTLLLHGRATVRVGRDGFRTEAGAFSVLAREALRVSEFQCDFTAFITSPKASCLRLTKPDVLKAIWFNKDESALETAISKMAAHIAGESFRERFGCDTPSSVGRLSHYSDGRRKKESSPRLRMAA